MDARKNFAFGTLTAGIASGATSCTVGSGEGARFPAVSFNAVIWNTTDYTHPSAAYHASQAEIVRVTNISTDTLTITRAQEGTTARDLNTGGKTYQIWAGPTDGYWDQLYANGDILTTRGDLVRMGATVPERFAAGSRWQTVRFDGTDVAWGDDGLFGALGRNRFTYICATGGNNLAGIGDNTTATGTGSAGAVSATVPQHVNIITSAATTGTDYGLAGNGINHFSKTIRAHFYIRLEEITATRVWVGFTSSTGATAAGADDPASAHMAAFRFSTDASDTNWRCCTKDGTTLGNSDSSSAVDTNWVLLSIEFVPSTSAKFFINGTLVATRTTNLPGSAIARFLAYGETRENVNKNLEIAWIHIEESKS